MHPHSKQSGGPLALFGKEKSFHHPWVGHTQLNRIGLHPLRIMASDLMFSLRRACVPRSTYHRLALERLKQDGVAAIECFLPDDVHAALRAEAYKHLAVMECNIPLPHGGAEGFGAKKSFAGGFDRFDGNSLNRFLAITPERLPGIASLLASSYMHTLLSAASGMTAKPSAFWLQYLQQGRDREHFDIQKQLHRDTFHHAFKLWYFFDEVQDKHGPFEYVLGSHHADRSRLLWEYQRSLKARSLDAESHNGSFRAEPDDLRSLRLAMPQRFIVPANTLVIANVRGFHRRGEGMPGAVRIALHAGLRPHPFRVPWPLL